MLALRARTDKGWVPSTRIGSSGTSMFFRYVNGLTMPFRELPSEMYEKTLHLDYRMVEYFVYFPFSFTTGPSSTRHQS
uniref:Uncharacterized protein n=1 Tax=Candidatus Kentrum sp. LFY TaxID=2126342 RepID=A0A450WLN2_9GAMM|nr:MAG: hypothetical protein BECKLFY1418C_GA0070996_10376 [Candidatus Kentron sp. LFY]